MKSLLPTMLAGTLVLAAGCASNPRLASLPPVGPEPGSRSGPSRQGALEVYSARPLADQDVNMREYFWDDYLASNEFPRTPAHTGYAIYTGDGRFLQAVANASNPDDAQPTRVTLPPGLYQIQAQARGHDPQPVTVRVPVLIRPGQTTSVHLEGNWQPPGSFTERDVVRLPNGDIVGWNAGHSS